MARYIDADKLVQTIERYVEPYKTWDCTKFDVAMEAVDDTPAADVVEVVRCDKCKHYLEPYCTRGVKERYGLVCVERTDFCSRGERSENVEV